MFHVRFLGTLYGKICFFLLISGKCMEKSWKHHEKMMEHQHLHSSKLTVCYIVDVPIEMVIFRSYVNLADRVSSMKNRQTHGLKAWFWKHDTEASGWNILFIKINPEIAETCGWDDSPIQDHPEPCVRRCYWKMLMLKIAYWCILQRWKWHMDSWCQDYQVAGVDFHHHKNHRLRHH